MGVGEAGGDFCGFSPEFLDPSSIEEIKATLNAVIGVFGLVDMWTENKEFCVEEQPVKDIVLGFPFW